MRKVPIAVINWNGIEMTERCLEFLRRNTPLDRVEFWVVDNGSSDPSEVSRIHELKSGGMIHQVVRHESNLGFPRAFNHAFASTAGEIFCCVNNDCFVEPGWFEAAMKTLGTDDSIAAVCSNVYSRPERRREEDDRSLEHLYGPVMFIRRSAWESIGEFDARNFSPGYGEELDWSYRAIRSGYTLKLSGRSLAHHTGSFTMKKNYDPMEIRLVRLAHRIKCRMFNWPVERLLIRSWRIYWDEIRFEFHNRTPHLLIAAFLKNMLILPSILTERHKRLSGEARQGF